MAAASAHALAACEALLHLRAPPVAAPLPPVAAPVAAQTLTGGYPGPRAHADANGFSGDAGAGSAAEAARSAAGGGYLGVPRMWSAVAAWECWEPRAAGAAEPKPTSNRVNPEQLPDVLPLGEPPRPLETDAADARGGVAGVGPEQADGGDQDMDTDVQGRGADGMVPASTRAPRSAAPDANEPHGAKPRQAPAPLADFLSLEAPAAATRQAPNGSAPVAGQSAPSEHSVLPATQLAGTGGSVQRMGAAIAGKEGLRAEAGVVPAAAAETSSGKGLELVPGAEPGAAVGSGRAVKPTASQGPGIGLGAGESDDSEGSLPEIDSGLSSSDEESDIEE